MMVLQTSPLPLGYHTKKTVCLIYRRKIGLSIDKTKSCTAKTCSKNKALSGDDASRLVFAAGFCYEFFIYEKYFLYIKHAVFLLTS